MNNDFIEGMTNGAERSGQKKEFFLGGYGLLSDDIINRDRRGKRLIVLRSRIDRPDYVHPFNYPGKGCIALPVRVILAAKIESRLVTNANKELGGAGARLAARQGDGAVGVLEMGYVGRLVWYSGYADGLCMVRLPDASLYQPGGARPRDLVVVVEDAVERTVLIKAAIDIGQKGAGGLWRLLRIDLDLYVPGLSADDDMRRPAVGGGMTA